MQRGILVHGPPENGYDQVDGLPHVQGHFSSCGSSKWLRSDWWLATCAGAFCLMGLLKLAIIRLAVCHVCRGILIHGGPANGYDQIDGLPHVQGHSSSRGSSNWL